MMATTDDQQTAVDTMTVTVPNRLDTIGIAACPVHTCTIATACPRCGARRGTPRWDGPVQVWDNPCGHIDRPIDVIREANALILGVHADSGVPEPSTPWEVSKQ